MAGEKSEPVCIAGMHRSGTSMITKLLHLCGLYLGEEEELLPAVDYNSDGLWENRKFVELNEEILRALGGLWDQPPRLPNAWDDERLRHLRTRAEALLRDFHGHDPWGWKDPRNCLTLPLWLSLLPQAKVVVPCRNPLEVALSLRRRGYPSAANGLKLWQLYNQTVIEHTSPENRIITHYESYFSDPQRELVRVLTFLNLRVPQSVVEQACSGALADLRHGRFSAKQLREAGAPQDILALYVGMCVEGGWSDGEPPASQDIASSEPRASGQTTRRSGGDARVEEPPRESECPPLPPLSASPEADLLGRELELERVRPQLAARNARIRELEGRLRNQDAVLREFGQLRGEMQKQAAQLDGLQAAVDDLRSFASLALQQWAPEDVRKQFEYQQQVRRIRGVVRGALPADATLLVASKGDEELVKLDGRRAWHFPQTLEGVYAGANPANSAAAIAQLEALRVRGADFLLLPSTALWWLDHYAAFQDHLCGRYRKVSHQDDACVIYDLREPRASQAPGGLPGLEDMIADCHKRLGCEPAILDWDTGLHLARSFPHLAVFSPPAAEEALPYLEGSIDIVAVAPVPARVAEARRVARGAVVTVATSDGEGRDTPVFEIEWRGEGATGRLPAVSVIFWASAEMDQTRRRLDALRCSLPGDFRGEVLVLASGLAGASVEELRRRWGDAAALLKVLQVAGQAGYAASCNQAAAEAAGDVFVFLGDALVPLDGWLPPLLDLLESQPGAGAIGGKIIAADGTLDQAGGVVFADGSAAGLGGGDYQVDDPLYGYVREVDYSSDGLLATTRPLFRELGGFDPSYHDPTYANADYCFRAREQGHRVYYQPESVSASLPAVESHGPARDGPSDRALFCERWKQTLTDQPSLRHWRDRDIWHTLAGCAGSEPGRSQ